MSFDFFSIIFYGLVILSLTNIGLIFLGYQKGNQKIIAINTLILGISLMIDSFLAGFSIGGLLIFLPLLVWLFAIWKLKEIRIIALILLLVTLWELYWLV